MSSQRHINRTIAQTHRARFQDAPRSVVVERNDPAPTRDKTAHIPNHDAKARARDAAAHDAARRRATHDAEHDGAARQLKAINEQNERFWRKPTPTKDFGPLAVLGGLAAAGVAKAVGSVISEGVQRASQDDVPGRNDSVEKTKTEANPLSAFGDLVRKGPTGMNFGTPGEPFGHDPDAPRPTPEQLNWFNERYYKLNGAERDQLVARWREFLKTGAWR